MPSADSTSHRCAILKQFGDEIVREEKYSISSGLHGIRSRCLTAVVLLVAVPGPVYADALRSPEVFGSAHVQHSRGACSDASVLQNHDSTFESAYGWNFGGTAAPDYGAFAECFEGDVRVCEIQFFLSQLGHQSGQTMDVYLWEDTGTDIPGAVLSLIPGVDPGPVAAWPTVSQHNVAIDANVSGDWWAGYWGGWPGEQAGWLVAADENGSGGCPKTNISPESGLPSGWYHPDVVFSWRNAQSLGIQVAVDDAVSSVETPAPSMSMRLAPNPFSRSTTLTFSLAEPDVVTVTVFDTEGRVVQSLWRGRLERGEHRVTWDGTILQERNRAAGTYYVLLESSHVRQSRRVVLLGTD